MADYTYAQLSQMQKEAALRVQEMRKRAKLAAADASRQFDTDKKEEPEKKADIYTPEKVPLTVHSDRCCKKNGNQKDLLSKLFSGKGMQAADADKALILSLCFLLQAEKADEELILALLYLLT